MELKTSFDFDTHAKRVDEESFESSCYVTHIDSNDEVIACIGNGFVKLFDINTGKPTSYFGTGQKAMSDMVFANKHPNYLCLASQIKGVISIYDTRINYDKKNKPRPILLRCPDKHNKQIFSVAMDNNMIAGGGTNNIFIWDMRKVSNKDWSSKLLESYHSDEVTKVRFNTFQKNYTDKHLFSISEDTFINQYNIDNDQDTMLLQCYSCEKELWNFGFFHDNNNNNNQFVYALSNDDSLIVHKVCDMLNADDSKIESDDDNMEETEICRFGPKALDHMTLVDCFYDSQNYKQLCLLSCNSQLSLIIFVFEIRFFYKIVFLKTF